MPETEADKQIFANKFKIDLSGHVTKVSSIQMVIPKYSTPTGLDRVRTFRPGQPQYGTITIEGAEHVEGVKKIRQWMKDAHDGKDSRKDITIEIHNQKGETVRTFNLYRCLPINYNSIDLNS